MERTLSILPKGLAFARAVQAFINAKGLYEGAAKFCNDTWGAASGDSILTIRRWTNFITKAPIGAATPSDSSWAAPLFYASTFAENEFSDLVRAGSIIGKLTGIQIVPLNCRFPVMTGGASGAWVGAGAGIPVSAAAFTSGSLGVAQLGAMTAFTNELARNSTPPATGLLSRHLVARCTEYMDQQFIDPGVAVVANVNPASITNGASVIRQSTGNTARRSRPISPMSPARSPMPTRSTARTGS